MSSDVTKRTTGRCKVRILSILPRKVQSALLKSSPTAHFWTSVCSIEANCVNVSRFPVSASHSRLPADSFGSFRVWGTETCSSPVTGPVLISKAGETTDSWRFVVCVCSLASLEGRGNEGKVVLTGRPARVRSCSIPFIHKVCFVSQFNLKGNRYLKEWE